MKKHKKLLTALSATIGGGAIVAGLLLSLHLYSQNRLPGGTTIAGIDFSFKTRSEALHDLEKKANAFLDTEMTVTAEHKTLNITPRQLGVNILSEKTVQTLIKYDNDKKNLLDFFFPRVSPQAELIVFINQERLSEELENRLLLKQIAPRPANFYLENKNIQTVDSKKGFQIDREQIAQAIRESAKRLTPKRVQIVFEYKEPELTSEALEAQKEAVSSALLHTFTLVDPIYSDNWDERLIDNPDWVSFVPTSGKINIKINAEPFNTYLDDNIAKWLDVPAEKVDIYMDEEQNVIIEGQGNDGSLIKRDELRKKLEVAIANRIKNVPIPIEKTSPEIKIDQKLQGMGIKQRIAVGHTSFYGSPANRVHNIKLGTEKFNGKLVAPNEVFSFNTNLGQVDGGTGYRKELVIKPEGTVPEYGGGICQVSTTMYRAILFSALPIVERNQHSYAVSYYSQILGDGLDATIYLGGADLQFKNDTGSYLLIQAYTKDDYELFFIFYGTETGKTVEMDGPYLSNYRQPGPAIYIETPELLIGQTKPVEKKHTGFDAVWYRYITDASGAIEVETISTRYKAVPDKIQVGTRKE